MSRGLTPLGERFGRNLWRSRRRAGLTQGELAELVGIHRATLSALERGLSLPRLDTVLKLVAGWRPGRYVDGDFYVEPPAALFFAQREGPRAFRFICCPANE